MSLTLCISAATRVCSVALAQFGHCIALRESNEGQQHASLMTTYIADVLQEANCQLRDIDAVAIDSGPGSYTGLRIAAATAKGICYSTNKKLIIIDTLQALAQGSLPFIAPNDLIIPMIDARRMEVYMAIFDAQLKKIEATSAYIVTSESFLVHRKNYKLWIVGDAVPKVQNILQHPNIHYLPQVTCTAANFAPLVSIDSLPQQTASVAYFQPDYLKGYNIN